MSAPDAPLARPRRYSRRRAACLVAVHLAIGLHVAHWRLAGRTLAPLELNEVMHTLELGVVTAGFLLMATAVVSAALFGRFFCSWGCHLVALQDLSAWLLRRLRVPPHPFRSRLLRWVPAGAAFYMFAWPQVARWIVRRWPGAAAVVGPRPEFRLRIQGEAEGWASFLTTDFARNLPGPGVALLTFAVCGFVIVYLLGTRSFCHNVCPYGAVFSLADRLAPGRILLRGDCTGCARCTAVCDSGVAVHREIARWGRVTNGACLKDLDCVAACPTGGLAYGLARPPLWNRRALPPRHLLSLPEELLAGSVLLLGLASFRGLYRLLPFFLSLAVAALLAAGAVVALRLALRPEVRFQRWRLKRSGRLTRRGALTAATVLLGGLLTAHSAFVRAHEVLGDRAWEAWSARREGDLPRQPEAARALRHLEARARWGLLRPPDLDRRLAALLREAGRLGEAEEVLRRIVSRAPRDPRARIDLGEVLAARGRLLPAAAELGRAVELAPGNPVARYDLAVLLGALGRDGEAIAAYRDALRLNTRDAESHNNLGFLLWKRGAVEEAEVHLRRALALRPDSAQPCFNLAALLASRGRAAEAEEVRRRCRKR